ncbi:BspA family leucine-rich repeat surface protein, partial [Mitsuokella sp.]|uniref:BspA family leucine-rich repeat surface protein n=1 Tax=Mitsuokella sp. TaxID=2049034 RepID=UPI002A837AFD
VDALPMVYETKVGTYSSLVSLNADAELPKDGYCRYMSHFKGNSAIKVVVSYKVGVADLTMKVTRDGVLASVSTQLGNLSQKEDETRKKIDELHGNWVDVLFLSDTTVYVDNKETIIKGRVRTRLYPKIQLQFGGREDGPDIPLLWGDFSHLTSAIILSYRQYGAEQGLFYGCNKISSLDLNTLDISKNVTLEGVFSDCSSLQNLSIEGWDVSKVTNMSGMFVSCSSLQNLSIEGWDVSKVTNMDFMFAGCSSLQSLSIGGWDVSKVENMNNIFFGCSSLQSLDLSGWNLESCENIDYLGQYDFGPKTLKLGTGFFKCPATKASLRFTTWTDASVRESLVVNSYDRKANGLPDFTITLHANTKKVLTEDDIAAMTAKGYIIA